MAIYRAYRPAFFRDVIGQEPIVTALKNEVATGRLAHAYLFTGSRGTGKTTCAKILAKAVNCLNPQNGEPCGQCEICKGIDDGAILDVVEMDAASNNGVDYVRELREEAYYTPVRAKYRVYIIDECHMLSNSAFNALLKIIEEPPQHVLFILATTEVHKILPTILSRCQRFDFLRVPPEVIGERIGFIAEQEGFTVTPQAAVMLGRLGEGAVRDSLSLLDKCLSVTTDLTEESVASVTGITDGDGLLDLTEKTAAGDYEGVLEIMQQFYTQSKDFGVLCSQLVGLYRDLLHAKLAIANTVPVSHGLDLRRLDALARSMSKEEILKGMSALCKCRDEMGRLVDGRTRLEIVLAELAFKTTVSPLAQPQPQPVAAAPARPAARPAQPAREQEAPLPSDIASPPPSEESPLSCWGEILSALQEINPMLHGALVGSKAFQSGNHILIDTDNPLFFDMVRGSQTSKESIKRAIQKITGVAHPIGPYKKKGETKKNEKLNELLQLAKEAGIPTEIEE